MANLLRQIERRFSRFAIPDLTLLLIAGQVLAYVVSRFDDTFLTKIMLWPAEIAQGEWWRLVTFVFQPPCGNLLLAILGWCFFYFMGTALENHWGAFRYNVYLWIGYLATVAAGMSLYAFPDALGAPGIFNSLPCASNVFMGGSVLLAFAQLAPELEIMLMFVLPLKMKFVAALTWMVYGYNLLVGNAAVRILILASILNFLVFFGRDVWRSIRQAHRRADFQRRATRRGALPFHRCVICGITEKESPKMDFRYCSKCAGNHEYCEEHLKSHEHVVAGDQAESAAVDDVTDRTGQV